MFQSHAGSIEAGSFRLALATGGLISFNPTLVRLRLYVSQGGVTGEERFNPTLVRLRPR